MIVHPMAKPVSSFAGVSHAPILRGWADFFAGHKLPSASIAPNAGGLRILLDDARRGGGSFLLEKPERILVAHHVNEVRPCLAAARAALAEGYIVAGYLAYEAGAAFESRIIDQLPAMPGEPLAWFGCFETLGRIPDCERSFPLSEPLPGPYRAGWSADDHRSATERVLSYIEAGDIYQANLTFSADVPIGADRLGCYADLRARQEAGWGGMLETGEQTLLSLSPELFFTLRSMRLGARPMKGTAPRGRDRGEDVRLAEDLHASAKERAENLMIVDLLRNDFSRVAKPGTVKVPELFAIETYPTVHQMTSHIVAELTEGRDAVDVIEACFPCGSVTGTPKLRAMEVIAAVESGPRGAYTGSMGVMLPDGSAAFNVLIRTLCCTPGKTSARVNVGSAITIGSSAKGEWAECLAKLRFLGEPTPPSSAVV